MCYAFCIEHIGATIMQIGYIVVGTLVGPVLGVFTLGIFLPWCNTKVSIVKSPQDATRKRRGRRKTHAGKLSLLVFVSYIKHWTRIQQELLLKIMLETCCNFKFPLVPG